jgi:hypothetical protein
MSEPSFLLLAAPGGWRLAAAPGEAQEILDTDLGVAIDAPSATVATRAAEALSKCGHTGQAIVLGIPSNWCFSASIQTSDLPRNDRKAMVYRLEEKLPIAAEAVVADFVVQQGGTALGACTRQDTLRVLIEALESNNIAVQSIVPLAILVVQGLAGREEGPAGVFLVADEIFGEDSVEILGFESGQLIRWATVPASPGDVQLQLDMDAMTRALAPSIDAFGISPELIEVARKHSSSLKTREGDALTAAMMQARKILGGQLRPWIEFRRGPLSPGDPLRLHRRPLNIALAAGVALMLGLSSAMLLLGHRYWVAEGAAEQQLSDAFREQFPGWEVPSNVRAVIESEHRKAAASNGPLGAIAGRQARSAFDTLKGVLKQLPEGRFSIRKMTFEETSFDLEGQVRSYEQLDGIAAAARKAGLEVPAPESRKNADGNWDFTLHGSAPDRPGAKPSDEVAKGAGDASN